MDDYVLQLLEDCPATYSSDIAKEGVGRDLAMAKLLELKVLLDSQGVVLGRAKRYLDLLRGVAGLRGARATLVETLLAHCDEAALGAATADLCRALHAAARAVASHG